MNNNEISMNYTEGIIKDVNDQFAIRSKEQLQDIFLQLDVATAIYSGPDMVIELANDKMISGWGKDRSIIGKKLTEAMPQIHDSPILQILKEVFTTGITYHLTEQKLMPTAENDPERGMFNLSFKPLRNGDNNIYGILHMATEITERAETKEKLAFAEEKFKAAIKKTAELEGANNDFRRLNANLEQFVYIASHDLQEPLRKINIFSDMLQKSSAEINEEGKMYLSKIEKASKRMSSLINDLLEFSRISSNEKMFVPTDLNRIISDIKIDYELLIKQKNAIVDIEPLPVIEAIPLQMNQLFYNLIGNALKFTKKDQQPVITISCEMPTEEEILNLKLNSKPSFCKIIVKDNGIGFDPKYSEQIFEIFQRLHGKHEYAGTGIGLSLARKIAENHGGAITASSEEGKGAAFNVILPVRRD